MTWEEFQRVIARSHQRWHDLHTDDHPLLAIGRTWRLDPPDAAYMIVWQIDDFARIDQWTRVRRTDEASRRNIDEGILSVAEVDAGVYEDFGQEMH